jgi:hypothetical protein
MILVPRAMLARIPRILFIRAPGGHKFRPILCDARWERFFQEAGCPKLPSRLLPGQLDLFLSLSRCALAIG